MGNSISVYSRDSASGALSPVAASPFAVPSFPLSVTVDGSGKYLLIGHDGTTGVSVYAIDKTTGALTVVSRIPLPGGNQRIWNRRHLYDSVANYKQETTRAKTEAAKVHVALVNFEDDRECSVP